MKIDIGKQNRIEKYQYMSDLNFFSKEVARRKKALLEKNSKDIGTEPLSESEFLAQNKIPRIVSGLRHNILYVPDEIRKASGIIINGRRIKSLIFSTDIAIIKNCDADAVLAVYPFTVQQSISNAIIQTTSIPVFCGVGGGTTNGVRSVALASDAEGQGAMGVVLNAPISNENILAVSIALDIPVVISITNDHTDIAGRIAAGANILNIAAGAKTAGIIRSIRDEFPKIPIIATGGKEPESILETIAAGANAIVYTPPSSGELFRGIMEEYRK
jgi:hypothetical protein